MEPSVELVPLAQAVATGGGGNAYSWYRSQAHQSGTVLLWGLQVPAMKISGRWMVTADDVERAVQARQAQEAELAQRTADYEAGILHEGSEVQVAWGSYTVRGAFHRVAIPQPMAPTETWWKCNTCRKPVKTEHNGQECHRCRDWSPCGGDCTLTGVSCPSCETSLTF